MKSKRCPLVDEYIRSPSPSTTPLFPDYFTLRDQHKSNSCSACGSHTITRFSSRRPRVPGTPTRSRRRGHGPTSPTGNHCNGTNNDLSPETYQSTFCVSGRTLTSHCNRPNKTLTTPCLRGSSTCCVVKPFVERKVQVAAATPCCVSSAEARSSPGANSAFFAQHVETRAMGFAITTYRGGAVTESFLPLEGTRGAANPTENKHG